MEQEKSLNVNLTEVQKKINTIEEKYYINGDMPKEAFDRFMGKLIDEKESILKNLAGTKVGMANLKKTFAEAVTFSSKLTPVWTSSEAVQKEKIQKLIFPKGIVYLFENETFRTDDVNIIFAPIASPVKVSAENETGQTEIKFDLSSYVGRIGQSSNLLIKDLEKIREFLKQTRISQ